MNKRFLDAVKKAATWRLVLALLLLWCLRLGFLRGKLTPARRLALTSHYVGHHRRRLRRMRPLDLLLPVTAGQLIVFAGAAWSSEPVYLVAIGNIMIVAIAMLPSVFPGREISK